MLSRPGTLTLFFLLSALTFPHAQNLVINGAFTEGAAGWDSLLVEGGAQATKTIGSGEYRISISAAGNESWHVQLKQQGIAIDSGAYYEFAFDAWADTPRDIEASVGMEYGPYTLYTPQNATKFYLGTARRRFTIRFRMGYATDTNARIQFNCGLITGTVSIAAVSLEKITTPMLVLLSPRGGEVWSGATVQTIEWLGIGMETIDLFYSPDAGLTWSAIAAGIPNSGSHAWKIPAATSPWCLVRAAAGGLADTSEAPFEIGSYFNLVQNGTFGDTGLAPWGNLGVYGSAQATGSVRNGAYAVAINTPGTEHWNVQFSQAGIPLTQGETYVFSFTAWADTGRSLQVHIGEAGGAYATYLDDTVKAMITLSTDPAHYVIEFTMTKPGDTNARIDFNAGNSTGTVYIDNVALYRKRVAGIAWRPRDRNYPAARVPLVFRGGRWLLFSQPAPVHARILDSRGMVVAMLASSTGEVWWDGRSAAGHRCAPGIYLAQVVSSRGRLVVPLAVPGR